MSTRDPFPRLAELIAPTATETFFAEWWERAPLVIARGRADAYGDLLSLDDVDAILTTAQLRHPQIRLAHGTETPKADAYLRAGGRVDPVAVSRLFADGATIVIDSMQLHLPRLNALCGALEAETGIAFQTNLYLTPPGAGGFQTHYDTHDVFILQIAGTKAWELFDAPIALPLDGQRHDAGGTEPGAVTQRFTLRPGDLAYIPRGLYHRAQAGDALSLHVTLGALTRRWVDFLVEAVAELALRTPALRRALPPGFGVSAAGNARARVAFADIVAALPEDLDFAATAQSFRRQFLSRRDGPLRGQLTEMAALDALALDSTVIARAGALHTIVEQGEEIALLHPGGTTTFPNYVRPSIEALLSGTPVRVADIAGDLDDAGKLVLARRLIAEGLLQRLSSPALRAGEESCRQ